MEETTMAERFKQFCDVAFKTQYDASQVLGVSIATINRYRNGERRMDAETLSGLYAYGCNINWLLTGQESMYADNEAGNRLSYKNTGILRKLAADDSLSDAIKAMQSDIEKIKAQQSKYAEKQ